MQWPYGHPVADHWVTSARSSFPSYLQEKDGLFCIGSLAGVTSGTAWGGERCCGCPAGQCPGLSMPNKVQRPRPWCSRKKTKCRRMKGLRRGKSRISGPAERLCKRKQWPTALAPCSSLWTCLLPMCVFGRVQFVRLNTSRFVSTLLLQGCNLSTFDGLHFLPWPAEALSRRDRPCRIAFGQEICASHAYDMMPCFFIIARVEDEDAQKALFLRYAQHMESLGIELTHGYCDCFCFKVSKRLRSFRTASQVWSFTGAQVCWPNRARWFLCIGVGDGFSVF